MPRIDPATAPRRTGSGYPDPFRQICSAREKLALGDAGGLTDFGVNLVTLAPGAWSSQRHWHSEEDEFIFVLEGELTLVTGSGETLLRPGDCAAFPKGAPDGHHCINRSAAPARYLEIGSRRDADICTYPDIDLHLAGGQFRHKDGTPYGR